MPKVSGRFGPYPVSVVLDGSGTGTVSFQATGNHVRITNLYVAVSTTTAQARCVAYKGQTGAAYAIGSTNSGSTGASAGGNIDLLDGETVYVVWTGGDSGATATATFSGYTLPFEDVGVTDFRWDDPIAAADGSLVYPQIKSPNYVAGVSGWSIARDGSAEFNDVQVRGSLRITGSVNNSYLLAYSDSGLPAIEFQPGDTGIYQPPVAGVIYASTNGNDYVDVTITSPTLTAAYDAAYINLQGESPTFGTAVVNLAPAVEIFGDLVVDGVGNRRYIETTSQSVTNSTTLVDVPGATFNLAGGAKYIAQLRLSHDGPTAGDIRYAWTCTDTTNVTVTRRILAPAASTATNVDTTMAYITRSMLTQQIVGTPNAVANAFTGYQEDIQIINNTVTVQTLKLQFAQGTANAAATTVNGGYIIVDRVA